MPSTINNPTTKGMVVLWFDEQASHLYRPVCNLQFVVSIWCPPSAITFILAWTALNSSYTLPIFLLQHYNIPSDNKPFIAPSITTAEIMSSSYGKI